MIFDKPALHDIPKIDLANAFKIALRERKYESKKIESAGDSIFYILKIVTYNDNGGVADSFTLTMQFTPAHRKDDETFAFHFKPSNSISGAVLKSYSDKYQYHHYITEFVNEDYYNQSQSLLRVLGDGILKFQAE